MKKIIVVATAAMMLGGMSLTAQSQKKKQKKETRGELWMKQITTNDPDSLTMLIHEMAAAGDQGMRDIVKEFVPPQEGKSTLQEYAVRSVVDYVLSPDGQNYKAGVRLGLTRTFERCLYEPHRIFLLSQLARCAMPEDMELFVACLEDKQVADFAMTAMANMKGIDKEVETAVKNAAAPKVSLARLIEARNLKDCDDILASWIIGADTTTLKAIYSALAATGTEKALNTLEKAAGAVAFGNESSDATQYYITLLNRLTVDNPELGKQGGKLLLDSNNPEAQSAGIRLWLQSTKENGIKELIETLKSSDITLQRTALTNGARHIGNKAFAAVATNFDKLPTTAKVEVLKWFGEHRAKDGVPEIVKIIEQGNGVVLSAAMNAAAKIGDEAAVEALVARLGKKNAEEAKAALMAFDGDISECLTKALSSKDKGVILNILPIAAAKKVKGCYNIVIKYALSDDKQLSEAALEAIGGVAGIDNYPDLCRMIEEADANSVSILQKAAKEAVRQADADTQYEMAVKAMKGSAKPSRYYPLIAQSGTDNAMQTLINEKNNDANTALLDVKNPKMLPILTKMAKQAKQGSSRDMVLERYLSVCNEIEATPEERYLMLAEGDEMNPSKELRNSFITSIGHTQTIQALAYLRRYYDTPAHIDAVAEGVKDILTAKPDLNGGKNVKAMLIVARSAFDDKRIDDPKADLIVDTLKAMMAKSAPTGYVMSSDQTKMGKRGFWMMKDNFEDFDLSFDWRTTDILQVQLRSIPVLTFDDKQGAQLMGKGEWIPYNKTGNWNTANIHVAGNSVTVSVNGHLLFTKEAIAALDGELSGNAVGYIGFGGGTDSLIVKNTRIRKLPSSKPQKNSTPDISEDGKTHEREGKSKTISKTNAVANRKQY